MKIAPYEGLTLSENQLKVLRYLVEEGQESEEGSGFYIRGIEARTGLVYRLARLAVRALARKGLTEFTGPLFNDDGQVAGSGYRATPKGHEVIGRMDELERVREEAKSL